MTMQDIYQKQEKSVPEFTHICKYCNEVTVTLRLENIQRGQKTIQRWVARNQLGDIHNCITGRY